MGTGVPLAREPIAFGVVSGPTPLYVILDETFKAQVKLERVDNTTDKEKPLSDVMIAALATKQTIGAGGGVVPVQFSQASAATTWFIPHNLGHRPVINIYTTGWVEVVAQIVHTDANNTQVLFDTAQAGYALLL